MNYQENQWRSCTLVERGKKQKEEQKERSIEVSSRFNDLFKLDI